MAVTPCSSNLEQEISFKFKVAIHYILVNYFLPDDVSTEACPLYVTVAARPLRSTTLIAGTLTKFHRQFKSLTTFSEVPLSTMPTHPTYSWIFRFVNVFRTLQTTLVALKCSFLFVERSGCLCSDLSKFCCDCFLCGHDSTFQHVSLGYIYNNILLCLLNLLFAVRDDFKVLVSKCSGSGLCGRPSVYHFDS